MDDWRTLDDDTVRLHELHTSLVRAGFTEREALFLTGLVLLRRLPDDLIAQVQEDADAASRLLRDYLPGDT